MKITTITYRRVLNLGKYETETLEVQAEIEEGDDPAVVFEEVKAFVHQQLGIEPRPPIEQSALY